MHGDGSPFRCGESRDTGTWYQVQWYTCTRLGVPSPFHSVVMPTNSDQAPQSFTSSKKEFALGLCCSSLCFVFVFSAVCFAFFFCVRPATQSLHFFFLRPPIRNKRSPNVFHDKSLDLTAACRKKTTEQGARRKWQRPGFEPLRLFCGAVHLRRKYLSTLAMQATAASSGRTQWGRWNRHIAYRLTKPAAEWSKMSTRAATDGQAGTQAHSSPDVVSRAHREPQQQVVRV